MRGGWPAILVTCARARQSADRLADLRALAEGGGHDWEEVVALAEREGVGPLLYRHLRDCGADLPDAVRRQLRSLYVRHRTENVVRLAALGEALDALHAASIAVVVLKGPVLIGLVYGDAALRPMSDLDILVPEADAERVEGLLAGAGWAAAGRGVRESSAHHLPALTAVRDGVALALEVHLDAISRGRRASLRLRNEPGTQPVAIARDGRRHAVAVAGLQPFSTGTARGLAFGTEELLWHLCHHLLEIDQQKMLMRISDLVSLAEEHAERLDWERLASVFPLVPVTLSLVGTLDALPAAVARHVAAAGSMGGIGLEYRGWPRIAAGTGRSFKDALRLAGGTLAPPEWWLRLHYARPSGSRLALNLRHIAAASGIALHRVRRKTAR